MGKYNIIGPQMKVRGYTILFQTPNCYMEVNVLPLGSEEMLALDLLHIMDAQLHMNGAYGSVTVTCVRCETQYSDHEGSVVL